MAQQHFPGLTASWLNGWLASVGATLLVDGLTLSWSDDPEPVAILDHPGSDDVAQLVTDALGSLPPLEQWPIARQYEGLRSIALNLSDDEFRERAALARGHDLGWMISSIYSDARVDNGVQAPDKGPFMTSMPGKANTPADRMQKVLGALGDPQVDVEASFMGVGTRAKMFGLGFDVTRIGSAADTTDQWVDPVIEALAFFALQLFPVRGRGGIYVNQRGWIGRSVRERRFWWPVWSSQLGPWAIDAMLDQYTNILVRRSISEAEHPKRWPVALQRLNVFGHYVSVPYEASGSSDSTRGYGSRRMW